MVGFMLYSPVKFENAPIDSGRRPLRPFELSELVWKRNDFLKKRVSSRFSFYICCTVVFCRLHIIPNQLQWLLEFKSHFCIHDVGPFVPSYKSRKARISFGSNCAVAVYIKRRMMRTVEENDIIWLWIFPKIRFIFRILCVSGRNFRRKGILRFSEVKFLRMIMRLIGLEARLFYWSLIQTKQKSCLIFGFGEEIC